MVSISDNEAGGSAPKGMVYTHASSIKKRVSAKDGGGLNEAGKVTTGLADSRLLQDICMAITLQVICP